MKLNVVLFSLVLFALFSFKVPDEKGVYLSEKIYRFHVGEWECTVINDGTMVQPLSAVFNQANRNKLSAVIQKQGIDTSAIKLSINVFVARNKQHTIVFDPGMGKGVDDNYGHLMENLRVAAIDSSKVDYVILTHGHWDHIGGVTNSAGKINFPNATFVMSKNEWDFWTNENNLAKFPKQLGDVARKNLPPLKDKMKFVNAKAELVPGVTIIPESGHTPGLITVAFSSGKDKLIYMSDVMHVAFQMEEPNASPIYDIDAAQALKTRKEFIELVKANKYKVFAYHFDFPGLVDFK
jgi:glyoxylase-like metal-dependent hydrolase (beta-lactamase superfamily II)